MHSHTQYEVLKDTSSSNIFTRAIAGNKCPSPLVKAPSIEAPGVPASCSHSAACSPVCADPAQRYRPLGTLQEARIRCGPQQRPFLLLIPQQNSQASPEALVAPLQPGWGCQASTWYSWQTQPSRQSSAQPLLGHLHMHWNPATPSARVCYQRPRQQPSGGEAGPRRISGCTAEREGALGSSAALAPVRFSLSDSSGVSS